MTILTAAMLTKKGACANQVEAFSRAFGPDGIDLTDTSRDAFIIEVAILAEFDYEWAAKHLLSPKADKAYSEARATAYKAYSEAIAPAYKAYSEAIAPAYKAYSEARATAYKAYSEARAPAYKAYSEARATADKAYSEARATALLAALRMPS
jgi:hypothetical protein